MEVPPPPPPPPPLLIPSKTNKLPVQLVFEPLNANNESEELLSKNGYLNNGAKKYVTCITQAKSILQEGPTCGLVALLMAIDSMKITHSYTLDTLLNVTRVKGYTKMGEMFSGG